MTRILGITFSGAEREAIRKLRRLAIVSFRRPSVLLLLVGVSSFITFGAPQAVPTDSTPVLWAISMLLLIISTILHILFSPYLVVMLGRRQISCLSSLLIASVIFNSLATLLVAPFLADSYIQDYGIFGALIRVFIVLNLLSWAFIHVYVTLIEKPIAAILADANMPIQIFPQIRYRRIEALQSHLSANTRGSIRYLQAQDKYVQVVTANGSQLLSMSLTAAIAEIDPQRGMRVHRSLWMSWDEIKGLIYENGNPRIIAMDDKVWPVSRKHVKFVKAALQKRETDGSL